MVLKKNLPNLEGFIYIFLNNNLLTLTIRIIKIKIVIIYGHFSVLNLIQFIL